MKKRLGYCGIAVLAFALALVAVYEASTHVVRGWLRGEAFYDGRPTSYWRAELEPLPC